MADPYEQPVMSVVTGPALLLQYERWASGARTRPTAPGLLVAAWGALFVNAIGFGAGGGMLVPLPDIGGKLVAQGSLLLALLLALALNRRVLLRRNLFLVLLTGLAVLALMVSIHNHFAFGSTYRAVRLLLFIAVLWLLSPWWGRQDMLLLRVHRRLVWGALAMTITGVLVAPGLAFSFEGRLASVLWPIWPTQVAHLGAILFGTTLVLWVCHVISGRNALFTLAVAGAVIVATHTRTAILATLIGLAVATLSLFVGHVRARRLSAVGVIGLVALASFFASGLTAWAMRGQTVREARQLTGRTEVWSAILDSTRPRMEQLFGAGLSNQSFNGLAIDSTWLGMYVDQGLVGVVILATILLVLLIMASTHERGPHRAVALFLVVYCMVASITETGPGSATTYTLDLAVAAALLAPSGTGKYLGVGRQDGGDGRWNLHSRKHGGRVSGRRSGAESRDGN
ncbi:MAG: O-antigen ligase family protein [Nocardioides sp.]